MTRWAGWPKPAKPPPTVGLEFVPGVELSVEDEGGRFHLLGYLFDPENADLGEKLVTLRANRAARNEAMAVKMAELGLPVTMDDVRAEAGEDADVIARPHFAQALIKKGVVRSVKEAFDTYLSTGKPLYLPKEVLTPREAIALLHAAGGVAVMAHPGLVPLSAPGSGRAGGQPGRRRGFGRFGSLLFPAQPGGHRPLCHPGPPP